MSTRDILNILGGIASSGTRVSFTLHWVGIGDDEELSVVCNASRSGHNATGTGQTPSEAVMNAVLNLIRDLEQSAKNKGRGIYNT